MPSSDGAPPEPESPPPSAPFAPFAPTRTLEPVREGERIAALDLLRGAALLGIFFVNVQLFARPFGDFLGPIGGDAATRGEVAAWALIRTLCEYKFMSLFSLLFGIGMAMQLRRADAAGRSFRWLFARRLIVLAGFGLVHALALWYGDILFFYACCGVVLLVAARWRPPALLATGAAMVLFASVLPGGIGALQVAAAPAAETAAVDAGTVTDADADTDAVTDTDTDTDTEAGADADEPLEVRFRRAPGETAVQALLAGHEGGEPFRGDWAELERLAYGEGPFGAAVVMRAITYGVVTVSGIVSFLWRIAGLFLIGAALMKLDYFDASRRGWHRLTFAVGMIVGLQLEGLATWLYASTSPGASWSWLIGEQLHAIGSFALVFGYVGGLTLLAASRAAAPLVWAIGRVGRIALTSYLLETIATTAVMYWWGLGRFGTMGRPAMVGLVLVIYAGLVVFSAVWLSAFRMGPFEWLWRSLTYLRPQPILRTPSPDA